jgi:hypothetical protein
MIVSQTHSILRSATLANQTSLKWTNNDYKNYPTTRSDETFDAEYSEYLEHRNISVVPFQETWEESQVDLKGKNKSKAGVAEGVPSHSEDELSLWKNPTGKNFAVINWCSLM